MAAGILHFGDFELDRGACELRRAGGAVRLERIPLDLLFLLAERRGQLVTREEILERLWGKDVFVDADNAINTAIRKIRQALKDDPNQPRFVQTVVTRGYRFIAPVEAETVGAVYDPVAVPAPELLGKDRKLRYQHASEMHGDLQRIKRDAESGKAATVTEVHSTARRSRHVWIAARAVVAAAVLLSAGYLYLHRPPNKLTDKDTVVLAEFSNATGDPIFDGTLRQGLSSQFEQSPFLNVFSDSRIAQTLGLMHQAKGTRLTPQVAREVCLRMQGAATIEGSIASVGSQYVLGLKAVNCRTGDVLADYQVTANSKEQVLKVLGDAATTMRKKLGESLGSVQKYDTPIAQVTTSSLEALQAYSLGNQALRVHGNSAAAVAFYQRAINLDPNFAVAYLGLGASYFNLGQNVRAAESVRKSYDLRDHASEEEKLNIIASYQLEVTGNWEGAGKTFDLISQTYHRPYAASNLAFISMMLGEHEKALAEYQDALRLGESGLAYSTLVRVYLNLDRLEEARAVAQQAQARHLDTPLTHCGLYLVDFVQKDRAGMEREAKQVLGTPGYEDLVLYYESETAAYAGEFAKAREFTRRALDSAQRADQKETAASYEAEAAVREALVGNMILAKQQARAALALSKGKDVEALATIALELAGDTKSAARLANDLAKRFPEDTLVQSNYLPTIRAMFALRASKAGNPRKAVQTLAAVAPYELGFPNRLNFALYPAYVRGQAYLTAHQSSNAVTEFERILNHPGIVRNEIIGALARLQLGRAYTLSGDISRAKAAYQDFLTLWKDADPDIPIMKQAKAEYVKLK